MVRRLGRKTPEDVEAEGVAVAIEQPPHRPREGERVVPGLDRSER
jgi:hypothetical protein